VPVPPFATATIPVTFAAVPVVFWFSVGNVQFAKLPEVGVPRRGVTKVGLVDKTVFPEPVEVVTPVPPLATGNAVPDKVIANVPLVVMGEPVIDKNVGTVAATLVTEPDAPALDASNVTVPALFFAYSFMSAMFKPSSPFARLPDVGTAEAVVL
jgi:hypothetical protein